jgi:glyoxylase-like metal-dependent hydrolase (beta-lactamase superfamily II)
MLILGFPAGTWATNCYIVAQGPGEPCVIVDPGQDSFDRVRSLIKENRLLPAAVMLTHGHMDHVWSVAPVTKEFDVPAMIHVDDRYRLADPAGSSFTMAREQLLAMTKGELELTEPADVKVFERDGTVDIAGMSFLVRHAPGHTEGSVVFEHQGNGNAFMLSGDVLFAGSIGRTDLPGGNSQAMVHSLERVIWPAPDAMRVLPGHGPETTIGQEKASNPYLQGLQPPARGL